MSAASRATSVPRSPMAIPIWAARNAGASLTPSPVMATTSSFAFSALTSASFWLGRQPGEHGGPGRTDVELMRRQAGDVRARKNAASDLDPGVARDRLGGQRCVAGHHDDADAGAPTQRDRCGNFRPHGVLEADQSPEGECKPVDVLRDAGCGSLGLGHAENPQAPTRHSRDETLDVKPLAR